MSKLGLTLAEKIDLLNKIKSYPHGIGCRRLEKITGVSKSTIARVLSQHDKLQEEWNKNQNSSRKRDRKGKDPDVEEALVQWFSDVNEQDLYVKSSVLKSQAEEFAKEIGHLNFKATDGWLSRWKKRHGIKFAKEKCKKNTEELDWNSTTLPEPLQIHKPDLIHKAGTYIVKYKKT